MVRYLMAEDKYSQDLDSHYSKLKLEEFMIFCY